MAIHDDDLGAIWREVSTDQPPDRATCLTEHEWARLLGNEADEHERTRAATHLATCTMCADEYRLLQPLEQWTREAERVLAPHEAVRSSRWSAWRESWLSPRLALVMTAAIVLLVTNGVTISRVARSRQETSQLQTQLAINERTLSATQASLAELQEQVRTGSSAEAQLKALQQRVDELSTPQLGGAVVDLEPRPGDAVRGTAEPQIISTSPDGSPVTIILNHPPLPSRATLEVIIENETGQVRWTGRTGREQDSTSLALVLPSAYPAGRYVIRVVDVTRGRTPLGVYTVVIQQRPERSR
jgi:hypothetical protein